MSVHPAVERLLASMPWLTVKRAPLLEQGRYYPEFQAILVRHGLRGGRYNATVIHEALHAQRGDRPCVTPELEARQESSCERDSARLLIDIRELAEVAAAYPDNPHMVAELLDVDYDTLATRIRWLHPAERHFLRRRLEHAEESA